MYRKTEIEKLKKEKITTANNIQQQNNTQYNNSTNKNKQNKRQTNKTYTNISPSMGQIMDGNMYNSITVTRRRMETHTHTPCLLHD